MLSKSASGWCFVTLIISSLVMTTIALPQQQIAMRKRLDTDDRKFAEKPNALKKVALDDLDDEIQSNQIGDNVNGFSWTNVMGSVLQMLFNGGLMAGPNKSDDVEPAPAFGQSPWAQIFSVGLKLITTILGGGGQQADGIDKVDNGPTSPMQVRSCCVFLVGGETLTDPVELRRFPISINHSLESPLDSLPFDLP